MLNASSTDSPMTAESWGRATTQADLAPTLVTLTSILTETVHPTWVLVESTTVAYKPETTQTETIHSETPRPETIQTETTHQETVLQQTLHPDTSSPTPISATVTSQLMENRPIPHSSEYGPDLLGHLNTHTRAEKPVPEPSSIPSISISQLSSTTWSGTPSGTPTSETGSSIQLTTSSMSPSQSSTSSSSTSSQVPDVIPGSTSTEPMNDSTGHSKNESPNVGPIVGSVVGGTAFIALCLLACFLFRRRRRTTFHRRQTSRQRLLRTSHSMSPIGGSHHRQYSQPSFPIVRSLSIPSAPVFPARRYSSPHGHRPNPAPAASNPDLSLDRMYPRGHPPHRISEDPFADPEESPFSPMVEVSPPSRTASLYSQSSWEGGFKPLECFDSSPRSIPYGGRYYPNESTLTLPGAGGDERNINTRKSRASVRSDPFDLEPPPNVLQKWPDLPPRRTAWGDGF